MQTIYLNLHIKISSKIDVDFCSELRNDVFEKKEYLIDK